MYLNHGIPLATRGAFQMILMGASYLGGVVFYAARVPERVMVARLDLLLYQDMPLQHTLSAPLWSTSAARKNSSYSAHSSSVPRRDSWAPESMMSMPKAQPMLPRRSSTRMT